MRVLLHSVRTSACTVEGKIAARTASVHKRAARISIARRAGHACSSSCTSGTTTFVESLRTVRGARAAEFASAYAALRLQLGLRRSSRCARLHANAMEYARKPSQRLGQRGCNLKFDSHGVMGLRQRLRVLGELAAWFSARVPCQSCRGTSQYLRTLR